jgi:hypothetical protein
MLREETQTFLLERPRSNCGACSICSRYICPGVYQRQQVGPDYLTTRSPPTALRLRACPCERVFHARVCALHRTHLSIPVAHQRQRHVGRACPCERVFHAQVCALQITHISILAARQRQCHDGRACPCERVFHAQVCVSPHTSLFSWRIKDSATMAGLAPASVCSTLRFVNFSAHTSLFSQHVKDSATTAGLAPASVCSTLGCVHSPHTSLYSRSASKTAPRTFTFVARPKTAPRRQGLPLRACVPRSGVCTSAPSHLDSPIASEDRTTTAWLAPASICPTLRCVHVSAYTP